MDTCHRAGARDNRGMNMLFVRIFLVVAALAALGMVLLVVFKLVESSLDMWRRWDEDDEYAGELVDIGGNNWRPL